MKLHSREFACALRALVCAAASAAAMTIALHGQHCLAIDSQWNSDADGLFTDPARWDNVPNGLATFRRGDVSYTVQFGADTTINRLRVGTNAVTFVPSGAEGRLRIQSSSSGASQGAIIGELPGDDASLTSYLPEITVHEMTLGDGQSEWNTRGATVGNAGEGTLHIRNGARVLSGESFVGATKSNSLVFLAF